MGKTRRRVVVTGCGVVSAAGNELDVLWKGLTQGRCFIAPLRQVTFPETPDARGGEVSLGPDDELPAAIDTHPTRARCIALARAALRRALRSASLEPSSGREVGLVVGTTLGEERQVGELNERWLVQGQDSVDAGFFDRSQNLRIASTLARELGFTGPVMLNATACSSGNASLCWAHDLISLGVCDAVVAGGADALTRVSYSGFTRMSALSKDVCRPFDKDRDGVSFGEGAGMLVLEELESARARGARVLAELSGYGISNDAYHLTAPEQSGGGFARAIEQALRTTATKPEQVDYVSAHGTGTQYNDLGESMAMRAVFGARAERIPISSIKGSIGHTNGAASAIEAIACVLSLVHQRVAPTANLLAPDPALGLDFVQGKSRAIPVRTCLNLAAGFGGFNVCTVWKEAP